MTLDVSRNRWRTLTADVTQWQVMWVCARWVITVTDGRGCEWASVSSVSVMWGGGRPHNRYTLLYTAWPAFCRIGHRHTAGDPTINYYYLLLVFSSTPLTHSYLSNKTQRSNSHNRASCWVRMMLEVSWSCSKPYFILF